jgi:type II secretory pathway component PulL
VAALDDAKSGRRRKSLDRGSWVAAAAAAAATAAGKYLQQSDKRHRTTCREWKKRRNVEMSLFLVVWH